MQSVINQAVQIATQSAMNGNPVSNIHWVAPTKGSDSAKGVFAVTYVGEMSGSQVPWWDK